jgi:uncharacterized protein YggU (UPF0235/DUF167 family)
VTTDRETLSPVANHARGALLVVSVVPRASRTEMERLPDGTLRVRLAAAPVDGAANTALLRFLAEALDLPRSRLFIASGTTSRRKRIVVETIDADELTARVRDALAR